jgi:D-glycerate 3-kinase
MSGANSELVAFLARTAQALIAQHRRQVRIGVAGAQGSGKSTLCAAWAQADPRVAHFSMDDVYLTTAQRKEVAAAHGPLLKTRGAPGTHDLALATRVMMQLAAARARDATPLPRFDKLADAPIKQAQWPLYAGTPNIILVEGWCMGALAQADRALLAPVNDLERQEDPSGKARTFSNGELLGPYQAFFQRFDAIIMLAAPSFEVVPRWRLEQEAAMRKLTVATLPPEVRANIERFVQHFERLTRHMMEGGRRSDWTVALDEDRTPMEIREGL